MGCFMVLLLVFHVESFRDIWPKRRPRVTRPSLLCPSKIHGAFLSVVQDAACSWPGDGAQVAWFDHKKPYFKLKFISRYMNHAK